MLTKIKIYIDGIHCKSCKTLIETEVDVLKGVKDVNVNHQTGECYIEYDTNKISKKKIFEAINKLEYKVSNKPPTSASQKGKINSKKAILVVVAVILFILAYYLIKSFGFLEILSKLNEQKISYWLILLIGLLASFHCIGMCGGFVVTYTTQHSAHSAQNSQNSHKTKGVKEPSARKKPNTSLIHLKYNLGRIISYTTIGAVLGGFGSFFGVNPTFTGTITLVAAGFMVIMGLSLLTNFKWLEKLKLRTPDFIARFLYSQKHTKKPMSPFIIGIANGFMPCGPLQAIELYALASGSVVQGALSMGIYALGTVPLMFGFGNFISYISQERIKQLMKISGAVVIILGLFMVNRGLANFNLGFGGSTSADQTNQTDDSNQNNSDDQKEKQVVKMDLTSNGYSPNILYAKKGIPVRWVINAKQVSGCTNSILMQDYDIEKKLKYGENIIEFTPTETGEIKFSCWMGMVWGKFIITE